MTNETTVAFAVEDMTCGHCARTITAAVEAAFPGVKVNADTVTHRVTVAGASDPRAVAAAIEAEGYTPVTLD